MGPGVQVDSKISKTQTTADALDSLPDLPKAVKNSPVNKDQYADPLDSLPPQQNKATGLRQSAKPFCDSCKQAAEISNDKILAATIQKAQIQNNKIQSENASRNINQNPTTQKSAPQKTIENNPPVKQNQYSPDKVKVAIRKPSSPATHSIKIVSTAQNERAPLAIHQNALSAKTATAPQITNPTQGLKLTNSPANNQTTRTPITRPSGPIEPQHIKHEPITGSNKINLPSASDKSAAPLILATSNQARFSNFNQVIQTRTIFKESFVFASTANQVPPPVHTTTKIFAAGISNKQQGPNQVISNSNPAIANNVSIQTIPILNKMQIPANGPGFQNTPSIIKPEIPKTGSVPINKTLSENSQNTKNIKTTENIPNEKIKIMGFMGKFMEILGKISGGIIPMMQNMLGNLISIPAKIFSSMITGLARILGALLAKWRKQKRVRRKKESQADCDSGNQSDTTPSLAL